MRRCNDATLQVYWKTAANLSSFLSDYRNTISRGIILLDKNYNWIKQNTFADCPWQIQALVHLKVTSAKKIFFCHIVLNMKWMNFLIRRNNVSSSRYLNFCVLVNLRTSKSVKSSKALLPVRSYTFNYFFRTLGSTKMKFG